MKKAFVLRLRPDGVDMLEKCLADDRIVVGWPHMPELLNPALDWVQFRDIIAKQYHPDEPTLHKAGAAAGHLWRFIRRMGPGDLVVVPASQGNFHVARVEGDAREGDGVIGAWRPVSWLNSGRPIPRSIAPALLQSRMKVRGSSADASDLFKLISDTVAVAERFREGEALPTFEGDVRKRVEEGILDELCRGRVDSYVFERVVNRLLSAMGATDGSITPRRHDVGGDIVTTVNVLGLIEMTLVAQVKHYHQREPALPASVVDELLSGMDAHGGDIGLIITVGTVSDEALQRVDKLNDEGRFIGVVDGEALAAMYLKYGFQ